MRNVVEGFMQGWQFSLGDDPDNWKKWYPGKAWRSVDLPHDWSVEGPFSRDYSSGTGYLRGGTAWYRKTFRLTEEDRKRKVFLLFEGAYKNSQVWCNSYYLGKRPYGYIPFGYDISEQVREHEENMIAVRLEHEDVADSRWFTGSGITRPVQIWICDPVYIPPGGTFFRTTAVDDLREDGTSGRATTETEVTVRNESGDTATIAVTAALYPLAEEGRAAEEAAARAETTLTVETDRAGTAKLRLTLDEAALWSAEHPARYRLVVTTTSGESTDQECLDVGIRTFRFDPDEGVRVNGRPTKMRGLCIHHDAGALGAAVPKDVWRRRFVAFKGMGCNAIRTSHNPQDPSIYELCDEMGFYCLDELYDEWEGPKNKWSTGHNVYPPKHQGYWKDFPQWYREDVRDWVRRHRNHPSIFAWSIGNEVDYPNDPYNHPSFADMTGNNDANKPIQERQYHPDKPNAERLIPLAKRLIREVRKHDPTRPCTLGAAFPELSAKTGLVDCFDLVGYNYKEHLYAQDHARFPNKVFYGSENQKGYREWCAVRDNPYIFGQFLWTGIDFLGEAQGWPIRCSGAGLMRLDGYPKEHFYERQAMWCDTPVSRLATCPAETEGKIHWQPLLHLWHYAPGQRVRAWCFTNGTSAELFLNGTSQGVCDFDAETGRMEWEIPYEPGTLKVVTTHADGTTSEDEIVTGDRACAIRAEVWSPPEGMRSDDETVVQVEVSVRDAEDRVDLTASHRLYAKIEGGARILGMENGDIADRTEYTARDRRVHEGRMIIYVKKDTPDAEAVLKISGDTLVPAVLTV